MDTIMKLRHILSPFDFSDVSTHALEQAVGLARATGARLTVLHVFLSVMPTTGMSALDSATAQIIEPEDLEGLRARVTAACRSAVDAGSKLSIIIVGGAPAPTILEHAASNDVDLIVMGTHGTSGVQHLILGSVTEKVLRKAACPVLTVPPRATGAPASFGRVIVAVDFSDCSRLAVKAAAAMTDAGVAVTLVHVLEWPWHEPPVPGMDGLPAAQAEALLDTRRYLETGAADGLKNLAASLLPGRVVAIEVRFGRAYTELLASAREREADLIVMGVRGRTSIDIGFFGSTTNHVVRAATCPVLTVRG
jgi:nucleotide-binding universal stress UspA family protein